VPSELIATATVLRYAAFTSDPTGGNPAGIVTDATALDDATMQAIAAEVGYAETAFLVERGVDGDARRSRIRYFSPIAEVPFCGHATIATAVVLAEREGAGAFVFDAPIGAVVIETEATDAGVTATFTSAEPRVSPVSPEARGELLALLGITEGDLDERYPLLASFTGNTHPIVVLRDRATFDGFVFDSAAARTLLDAQGWITITVVTAASPTQFEARNIFPVGTITEDPATGSAAASLGGYLREAGLLAAPATVVVHQGAHVGRPSLLTVEIPAAGGIRVSGSAVAIS
jgi:PhzF family phenazine biosynthesis protein